MRDDARKCTATSKRTGKRCRFNVYKRPDGSYTTTCRYHSGGHQLREPGDVRNGGAPPKTFRYSTHMRSQEDRDLYESARSAIGSLDEELCLARANLERFRRRCEEQSKSGIPISVADGGKSVTVRPYAEIESWYLDLIRKLEESRKKLLQSGTPDNDDSETFREWLAEARSSDDGSSGSGPSSAPAPPPSSTPER